MGVDRDRDSTVITTEGVTVTGAAASTATSTGTVPTAHTEPGATQVVVMSAGSRLGRRRATPRPRPGAERNLVWLGLTACTFGLCMLLFIGYAFVFSGFAQSHRQVALDAEFFTPAARVSLNGGIPADGTAVAILQIPAIALRQVVVEGTTATDLLEGPGLMPGTARPGTDGNAVIAGRRQIAGGPFGRLDSLRSGDRVVVTTGLGRFVYRVVLVGTVDTGVVDPISDTHQARLTLVTSNSDFAPSGRLYVVAALRGIPLRGPSAHLPRRPPDPAERGLSGDPTAVLPSVLWGLALALVLGASIWAYQRRRDQLITVYLLTTPIVLALALMWYSNLIRLLPATL